MCLGDVSYAFKLQYFCLNTKRYSFFTRLPHRLWNSFPSVDLRLPFPVVKNKLLKFFWSHFISEFHPSNLCTFHFVCPCMHARNRCTSLSKPLLFSQLKLAVCLLLGFLSFRMPTEIVGNPSVQFLSHSFIAFLLLFLFGAL